MEKLSEGDFIAVADLIRKAAPKGVVLLNPYVTTDPAYKSLLKTQAAKSVRISKDTRSFSFSNPCYVRRIDFRSEDVSRLQGFLILTVLGLDGVERKIEGSIADLQATDGTLTKVLRYSVGKICSEVRVRLELSIRAVRATSFAAYGYTLQDLDGISARINQIESIVRRADQYASEKQAAAAEAEDRISAAEVKLEELNSTIEELEDEKGGVEKTLAILKKELATANDAKAAVAKSLAEAQARLEVARNNEIQLRQTVDSLNRDISDKQSDLKRLVNDRSLISDEFSDYVKEGRRQSWVYTVFIFLCVIIIGYCSWQLYDGANRILVANIESGSQLAGLILQRLPFAAAISLIVTAGWKLAQVFIGRVMTIHAQRLALARLLVVAKDTVYSSTDGLDITDVQRFRERIRLKLMMLKSHLTSELGRDFDYVPEQEREAIKPLKDSDDPGDE